jgi:hypothetical protein
MWAVVVLGIIGAAAVFAWSSGSLSSPVAATTSDNTSDGTDDYLDDETSDDGGSDVSSAQVPMGGPSTPSILPALPGNTSAQVQAIAQAIAAAEGYGPAGNIPTKANNPGDLCMGDQGQGVITSSGGEKITVYSSAQAGWNALYNQINLWINGGSRYYNVNMTWVQIGATWAGPGTPWAANVAAALGVDPNSTLAQYLGS